MFHSNTTPNVLALHAAAEALAGDDSATTPAGFAAFQRAQDAALAARATAAAEIACRIALLRDTLAQDEASDFAFRVLDAIAADLAQLGAVE